MMVIPTNWYAVFGMSVFVGGIWLFFRYRSMVFIGLSVGGFFFSLLGLLFKSRREKRDWVQVMASCVDREIGCAGARSWSFRLRCNFIFDGKAYTVTPLFWRSFESKEDVEAFLEKVINKDGGCLLHVNPKNPLQTVLVGGDVADKLIYHSGPRR